MQGPANPIPDTFWVRMFQITTATMAVATFASLYAQRRASRQRFASEWAIVSAKRGGKSSPATTEVLEALRAIHAGVMEERKAKKGASVLVVHANVKALLQHLKLEEDDDEMTEACCIVLQLIMLCFAPDPETRTMLHRAGGYARLAKVLSEAHSHSNARVMDLTAECLREVTEIEEREVILSEDVPPGSEGTYALSQAPLMPKMLRTLELDARMKYLVPATAFLANIATLRAGALSLARGTDDLQGLGCFVELLSHGNALVVSQAARAISSLCRHSSLATRTLLGNAECFDAVYSLVDVKRDIKTVHYIFATYAHIYGGPQKQELLAKFAEAGLDAVFTVWVAGVDKDIRDEAEMFVAVLSREATVRDMVKDTYDAFAPRIRERKARDEEERKKEEEKARQQEMFQHMMMQQMGGGGGMPGGMPPGMNPAMLAAMMGGGGEEDE